MYFPSFYIFQYSENGVEPAENFAGVIGSVERRDTEDLKYVIRFSEITANPNYGKGDSEGDIALLKLTEPVELSDWIQPVCLPESGRDFELEYVQAMGWGLRSNGKRTSVLYTILYSVHKLLICLRILIIFYPKIYPWLNGRRCLEVMSSILFLLEILIVRKPGHFLKAN